MHYSIGLVIIILKINVPQPDPFQSSGFLLLPGIPQHGVQDGKQIAFYIKGIVLVPLFASVPVIYLRWQPTS